MVSKDLIEEQTTVVAELHARLRQQAAVAELGQQALAALDLAALIDDAVVLVAATLAVEFCEVLELNAEQTALLLRAGVGWRPGAVGAASVAAGRHSQAGYTLLVGEPVIVEDLRAETRFEGSRLLHDHGIVSGLCVTIGGHDGTPFGVLGAYTTTPRRFSTHDVHFLQSIANVLGMAAARQHSDQALRASHDQLAVILGGVADGITAQDPTGRIVFANDAAARLDGYPSAEELLAAPPHEVTQQFEIMDEVGQPLPLDRLPGRRVLRGAGAAEALVRFRTRATGEQRWLVVRAAPVVDERGRVKLAINIFHDVTAQVQAQQTHQFLAAVSDVLAQSLEYRATLQRVAGLAVPYIADWCCVDIREADGSIQRLAVVHREAGKRALAEEFQQRYPVQPDDRYGVAEVLRSGVSRHVATITEAMLRTAARDDEHLRLLLALGVQSAMIVPLIARGRILGALSFAAAESGRRYGPADVRLAEEVAQRASLAVDNARLYQQSQQARASLRRSHDRLRIVHELDRAIIAAESLEAVALVALEHVRRLVPCDRASVTLFDAAFQHATVLAVLANDETQLQRGDRRSIVGLDSLDVLRRGEVHVDDNLFHTTTTPWLAQLAHEGIRTLANIPLLNKQTLIGTLNLGSAQAGAFTPEHLAIAQEVANQVALALAQARLVEQVQAGNERLQRLSQRLMEVQELERRYLARELHDEIGQALTGLKLLLESTARTVPEGLQGRLQDARSLAQELMERVHQLSLDLRPGMLDDLGLLPALLWHFQRYTSQTRVQVAFRHRGIERRFAGALETAVYRIVQEALTNVARHAQVSVADVRISADAANVRVQIVDRGVGFDANQVLAAATSSGVTGMQERAALLRGRLTISSATGRGTAVSAVFPIALADPSEKEREG